MKLIVNAETNEQFVEELTETELAEYEALGKVAKEKAEMEQYLADKKAEALAKLESLGLDLDDLKALGF